MTGIFSDTTDASALVRLLQLGDSQFPSGGFAFSHGLESLVEDGLVRQADDVESFVRWQLLPRWAGLDRVFLTKAHAHGDDLAAVADVDEMCERHMVVAEAATASRKAGAAALLTHARMGTPGAAAYRTHVMEGTAPGHAVVVTGLACQALALSRVQTEALGAYVTIQACLGAAIRLGVLGALEAQRVLVDLTEATNAVLGAPTPLEPAALCPLADIAAARHAGGGGRLFAS